MLDPRSFPILEPVPALDLKSFTNDEKTALQEITTKLKSNQPFNINFQRADGTRVAVDFTGKNLSINVFCTDGTRLEHATTFMYMGALQWGGGINTYRTDGSLNGRESGVYPRKFNSALDVFNYTINQLRQSTPKPNIKKVSEAELVRLHEPLNSDDLKIAESLAKFGQVTNPREVAQEGALTKMKAKDSTEEFIMKRLTNGRLLESGSKKIFLRNLNSNHFRLIEKLDDIKRRDTTPFGTPVNIPGLTGLTTMKSQPVFLADGITPFKEPPQKRLALAMPTSLVQAA